MSGAAASWVDGLAGAERATDRDGIESIHVDAARWVEAATAARDAGFARFIDLTAFDDPKRPDRFDIALTLYSLGEHRWVRLRTRTAGALPSLTPVFAATNWYEREVFDMFGVTFAGHPNPTRILLPDDFPSHPLRRDHSLGDEPVEFRANREADE